MKNTIDQSKVGDIIKFTDGYYTDSYLAQVIEVGEDYIKTKIPHARELVITKSNNWDYHFKRCKIVGDVSDGRLLDKLQNPNNGKPTKNKHLIKWP